MEIKTFENMYFDDNVPDYRLWSIPWENQGFRQSDVEIGFSKQNRLEYLSLPYKWHCVQSE